jgi:hypothetical protein
MILASTVSILVSVMVWRACHRSAVGEVAINWHDLFRATHTGKHTGDKLPDSKDCLGTDTPWREQYFQCVSSDSHTQKA